MDHVYKLLHTQQLPKPQVCLHCHFICTVQAVCVCVCVSAPRQDKEAFVGYLMVVWDGREHRQHQAAEHHQETATQTHNTYTQSHKHIGVTHTHIVHTIN